jgi:hypothetical protein
MKEIEHLKLQLESYKPARQDASEFIECALEIHDDLPLVQNEFYKVMLNIQDLYIEASTLSLQMEEWITNDGL